MRICVNKLALALFLMIVLSCPAKERTTVKSIIDGMVKIPERDYWLAETERTQGQWFAVMGNNPSARKGANRPVECVSKNDADAFIEKLNTCAEVRASQFEFSLPTSEEWLHAVQAGGAGSLEDQAWMKENCGGMPHEVATKSPNAFGLYDMRGNVWEWMGGPRDERGRGIRRGGCYCDSLGRCVPCWHTPADRRYDSCGLRVAAHVAKRFAAPPQTAPAQDDPFAALSEFKNIVAADETVVRAASVDSAVAVPSEPTSRVVVVPEKAEIEKASKVVGELCAEDYKALRNNKTTSLALARKLLAYVKMTDDPAAKFVLYQDAFTHLVAGGELERAAALFDAVWKKCGARYAVAMSENANFKAKSCAASKQANKLPGRISALKQSIRAIDKADKKLAGTPSDKALKQQKANDCVKIGDWSQALALYAEEENGKLGKVARWERAEPDMRSAELSAGRVGDFWWEQIEGMRERDLYYESVARHAVQWYEKAIAGGGMSDLRILLVRKRIATMTGDARDALIANNGVVEAPASQSSATSSADVGPVVLLSTVEMGGGISCRYTLQKPRAIAWTSRLFDDAQWRTCRTEINERVWNSSDIWVRTYFDCPVDGKKIKKLILRYRIDDDIEVWLNEKPLYQYKGAHGDYWDIPIEVKGNLIRSKRNVLCVHAHNISGPQYVDFGLTAILSEK